MQALLHMIDNEDDVRRALAMCSAVGLTIVHRKIPQELDEDIVNRGWFVNRGCWILELGVTFGDRWRITGRPDRKGKPFTGLCLHFVGTTWIVPRELLEAQVTEAGGRVVDTQDQADVIVVANRQAANLGSRTDVMIVAEEVFRRALPGAPLIPQVVSTKPLNDEAANIWRLFSSCDLLSIEQGINRAGGFSGVIDDLLEGVEVEQEGELVRGQFLSVTGAAQPFLNVALLGLLSVAAAGTRAAALRACVRKIVMTVAGIPKLRGFERIEELQLTLSDGASAEDLSTFGPLPSLRVLSIASERCDVGLSSLAGLEAPALLQVSIRAVGLRDVDALCRSPRLQSVDLGANSELKRIDGLAPAAASLRSLHLGWCYNLESIESIEGARQLRRVVLNYCRSLVSVKPLSACEAFDELDLTGCTGLTSIEGLAGKPVGGTEFSLHSDVLTSLSGLLPALGPTITKLDLRGAMLRDLVGIESARNLKRLVVLGTAVTDLAPLCSLVQLEEIDLCDNTALIDAGTLGALPHLNRVDLGCCRKLERLPARWSAPLESLDLIGCKSLQSLDGLPESLTGLDLRGCSSLRSLNGLPAGVTRLGDTFSEGYCRYGKDRWWENTKIQLAECARIESLTALAETCVVGRATRIELDGCVQLRTLAGLEALERIQTISLPPTITDVSALAQHRGLTIEMVLKDFETFPEALGKALSALPDVRLEIRGLDLQNCSGLAAITSLMELDLRYSPKLRDIGWVVGLPTLERLFVEAGSPAADEANGSYFGTKTKIRELQQAICAKKNIPLPPHLAPIPNEELVTREQTRVRQHCVWLNPADGLEYVWIPPGEFWMGAVPGDEEATDAEKPRHEVTISRGFWMGSTPVTANAFRRFCESTGAEMPEEFEYDPDWTGEYPIVNVDWEDAAAYCAWAGGRLPTEAEWEYAARGGLEGCIYPWGNELTEADASFKNLGGMERVGRYPPNGFGLYDMAGTVWEWCSDWFNYYGAARVKDPSRPETSGHGRVERGGSRGDSPISLRVSNRKRNEWGWYGYLGFRSVREVE